LKLSFLERNYFVFWKKTKRKIKEQCNTTNKKSGLAFQGTPKVTCQMALPTFRKWEGYI
jgi:hypothetical protein